ncbi:sugar transferase [Aequorivita sp. SDUM287046]|uniref:Sugar transferase n=1 Tax=Aequorivita aurantiaca TaxID=3053356 RepID=A0ABT8DGC1_9FLAO|nr:sugar transferase [Aequorivita aurantiaca]MDN3723958.1 sugar transferase [Aequorivita aurantiaca]
MFKRLFDIVFSSIALLLFGWIILLLILFAYIDTSKGIFLQKRIGQFGKPFDIYKIRTMHIRNGSISWYGRFVRNTKLDELPQLLNILWGQMSFVGPRPDLPGYYDQLQGEERKLLELKPGLCSRAALKYFNEEALLAAQSNPLEYNDTIIFPDKVRMNLEYYYKRSFWEDLRILWACFKREL